MNLGMTEIMIIMVIALIVFGPRKLPELGKSLGQALAQFRRASDDFKRTWEQEVELEKVRKPDHNTESLSESTDSTTENSYSSDNVYNPENPYDFDSWREGGNDTPASAEHSESADSTVNATDSESVPDPVVAALGSEQTTKPNHWI